MHLPRPCTQQRHNHFPFINIHFPPHSPLPPLTQRSNHTNIIQLPPLNPQPLINRLLHIRTLGESVYGEGG
jgi:hypothetical protein